MVRTQIQLTERQAAQLKELAHESNESISAIIRKALDQFLTAQQPDNRIKYRRALAIIGKYTSGRPDIAKNHDRYLEEDFRT
jgi:hypothetical protein